MTGLLIALAVIIVPIVLVIGIYNALVTLRNRYKNAYAQIDVQLKRRYDLIPNLVESTKAYLTHEKGTLENVTAARGAAMNASQRAAAAPGDPTAMQGLMQAEGQLAGALSKLVFTVEAYPDLKANQTISQLMEELTTTENKISFARQSYNDSVMTYNTSRETFPNVILAGMFGFSAAALYEITNQAEKEAPKVKF